MAASLAAVVCLSVSGAACGQEVFAGVYAHGVDTPLSLETGEDGFDLAFGVRSAPIEALSAIGRPAAYAIGSINTEGNTSFAGGGLSWSFGKGPVYVRPAVGLVVQDGPDLRIDPATRQRTDLGSRVLFEPELAIGYRLSGKVSLEASWMHVSHARLFNAHQNPGIDMMGVRLNYRLR